LILLRYQAGQILIFDSTKRLPAALKKLLKKKILLAVIIFSLLPGIIYGQSTNEQLWFEYMLNYSFANSYNLENAFKYSTVLNTPKWQAFEFAPTLDYSLTSNVDISFATSIEFTDQTESVSTFEVRPVLGSRIHITPNRRILTRVFVRLEQRNIQNRDTKDWDNVLRPRFRAEILIPINKKSYYDDNLWYGILDSEWFLSIDEDVDERFANRFRLRMGVGYRLSYTSRFEFIYMLQESKNAIEDSFYTSDNIFRFRYKHYLRKHKPSKMSGPSN
jgi:hypothetical protein